jgi:hypothetical protein
VWRKKGLLEERIEFLMKKRNPTIIGSMESRKRQYHMELDTKIEAGSTFLRLYTFCWLSGLVWKLVVKRRVIWEL